jgi:tetratricopeptide (TPR) repeat protein
LPNPDEERNGRRVKGQRFSSVKGQRYDETMWTRVVASLMLCSAIAAASAAEPDRDTRARALYEKARDDFEHGRYDDAARGFREAYLISQRAELLFNMASALERAEHPAEAAESLRAFLRVRPDDPDRGSIEEHVRALDEKQRLLDAARSRAAPDVAPAAAPTTRSTTAPARRTPVYKRWWLWTVVGAAAAGVALGVGFGVSRASTTSYPASAPSDGTFHF